MLEVVSLALAVVTLGVVASTVWLLRRQTRTAEIHSARSLQLELVRLSLEQPDLLSVFGDFADDPARSRLDIYRNLWLKVTEMNYLTGVQSELGVRENLRQYLANDAGIRWWEEVRPQFASLRERRDSSRFLELVEEEWQRAKERESFEDS